MLIAKLGPYQSAIPKIRSDSLLDLAFCSIYPTFLYALLCMPRDIFDYCFIGLAKNKYMELILNLHKVQQIKWK